MNPQDQRPLDAYLRECEACLGHLTVDQKNQVIARLSQEIQQTAAQSSQEMKTILSSFRPCSSALGRHLAALDLPPARPPRRRASAVKIILLSLLTLLTVSIVAILLLIKSLTPLWEFDDRDGTLTILGGRVHLQQDDQSFLRLAGQKEIEISGELPLDDVNGVRVHGETVNYRFKATQEDAISYQCFSAQDPSDFLQKKQRRYIFRFPGATHCLFLVPEAIEIRAFGTQGSMGLYNLQQNFQAALDQGQVTWKQENPQLYQGSAQVQQGQVNGDPDRFNPSGRYQGRIMVKNGQINLF